ncbi:hypothetical protein G3576_28500 [Roseomonas stagni]|uniref:Uncharacterized protein n=1 Tax=Falsiroseomonas algicola TaxID=2716930 RepID=A0A6M1LU59_9PROT|nr:hypothetical protein [Falsiroseomonas algicola]NGM23981.1 hypothetical protein [Falsiroseomonas algicola]
MVDHAKRIIAAIEKGGINRVVVIDDAFDVPVLTNEDAGPLLDFLESDAAIAQRKALKIKGDILEQAIAALNESEFGNEALTSVTRAIYHKFVENLDNKFDPAGRFKAIKGSNLEKIRPLIKLLAKCTGIEVIRIGSHAADGALQEVQAQVVFIDYLLDGALTPEADPETSSGASARQASLQIVRKVLNAQPGAGPSVILMSSHDVRDKADAFRKEIRDSKRPIFASRFHFLAKDDLAERDGSITVASAAAEALLDIAQQHVFAGAIEDALTHWKAGVDKAVAGVWQDISELELKDLAYLSRFRLAEEGQALTSYLEWFFGEVLVDAVARSVDWKQSSFSLLNESAAKGKPGSQIEGAFDGPTVRIAELYYRTRVDVRLDRENIDMRTGDIYSSPKQNEVLAVVTPECDLVLRKGKRAAPRLTVVAGIVHRLNAPDSSIADFIMRGNMPANVTWNPKDVRTIDYADVGNEKQHRLLGTLRPLYAYELQRRVLAEMGRVGLAVAPAMGMTARAEVVVRGKAGPIKLELPGGELAACAVIPSRGGTDKPRIIYHRSFVENLLEALQKIQACADEDASTKIVAVLQPKAQISLLEKLCRDGQADGEQAYNILSSLKAIDSSPKAPWCQILVQYEDGEAVEISQDDAA